MHFTKVQIFLLNFMHNKNGIYFEIIEVKSKYSNNNNLLFFILTLFLGFCSNMAINFHGNCIIIIFERKIVFNTKISINKILCFVVDDDDDHY